MGKSLPVTTTNILGTHTFNYPLIYSDSLSLKALLHIACNISSAATTAGPILHSCIYCPLKSLIPRSWRAQYSAADDPRLGPKIPPRCPSQETKLGLFALINGVTFVATITFGQRTVVHKLTFRKCGKPDGNIYWVPIALFITALSRRPNVANAIIIRATPGFPQVSVAGLVLLWCSRPRIAWFGALLFSLQAEQSMYFSTGVPLSCLRSFCNASKQFTYEL